MKFISEKPNYSFNVLVVPENGTVRKGQKLKGGRFQHCMKMNF